MQIEWDDDGRLLTEDDKDTRDGKRQAPSGSIEAAHRELPAPESLGITDKDLALNPRIPTAYVCQFFAVWKRRQREGLPITDDEIHERWAVKASGDDTQYGPEAWAARKERLSRGNTG